MTSNIGSSHLLNGISMDGTLKEGARDQVMEDLRNHFRPEFLNRVDETVVFLPLRRDQVGQIVELLLNRLRKRLHERKITLSISADALNYIADSGYDPVYGARPLKRFLQQSVETPLAREMIAGRIHDGEEVRVEVKGDDLAFEVKHKSEEEHDHHSEETAKLPEK